MHQNLQMLSNVKVFFEYVLKRKMVQLTTQSRNTDGYLRAVLEDVLGCERSTSMPGMPTCFIVPTVV